MSLNYKEIDLILNEIFNPIKEQKIRIQEVYQPSIQMLYMELYSSMGLLKLGFFLQQKQVRLHTLNNRPPKPKKPQRFQQLLQSKTIGMYVMSCKQIDENRIIKMHLRRNNLDNSHTDRFLYFKLWSNNTNIIFTDENNNIIDLLYRSPKQDLMPKKTFVLPEMPSGERHKNISIREWHGNSFNTFITERYKPVKHQSSHVYTKEQILDILDKHFLRLNDKKDNITQKLNAVKNAPDYVNWGNKILENLHAIKNNDVQLIIDSTCIKLDPKISPHENAQKYFALAQKTKRTYETCTQQLKECEKELNTLCNLQKEFLNITDTHIQIKKLPPQLLEYIHKNKKNKQLVSIVSEKNKSKYNIGISLQKDNFLIFIGRNAKENDALLRHVARGEDVWMHVYGNRGAFVFIRSQKKHTVPLSLLLECAQLAILYSKEKTQTSTDVYYTKTKYLKRVKKAIGLVIPSHTKTLHVQVQQEAARTFIKNYGLK